MRTRMHRPRASCIAAFSASVAIAAAARAQSNPQVQLRYEHGAGTEACPDDDELRRAVAARLGYDPFSTAAKRTVVVRVERRPRELAGRVELRDEQGALTGARDLTSPTRDCRELIAALSVAAAIGIDPVQGMTGGAPPKSSAPEPAPVERAETQRASSTAAPPPPPEVSGSEPPKALPPSEPFRVRGSVGALVALGAEPAPAPGFALGIGLRRGPFSVGLEGRADLTSSTSVTGGSVSASLLLVSLVPCLHYGVLSGCALGGVGAFRADGQGVTDPQHVTKPYGAAGGRFAFEVPASSSLAFGVHADLLATLSQTTLRLDNRDAWTSPALSATLGAGVIGTL